MQSPASFLASFSSLVFASASNTLEARGAFAGPDTTALHALAWACGSAGRPVISLALSFFSFLLFWLPFSVFPALVIALFGFVRSLWGFTAVARSVENLLAPPMYIAYYGRVSASGTCLWTTLLRLGNSPATLLHNGIYPWAHSVPSRTVRHLRRRVLPVWFVFGQPGHVSVDHFPHARFGLPARYLAQFKFGAEPYVNFGTSHPDKDQPARSGLLKVVGEVSAPRLPQLGGAQRVPVQYAFSTRSPHIDTVWSPTTFPADVIRQRGSIKGTITPTADSDTSATIYYARESNFQLHFPDFARRMTQYRSESPPVVALDTEFPQSTTGVISMPLLPKGGETLLQPRYAALAELYRGTVTPSALSGIDTILGTRRFAASRGNRLIAGWEAAALERTRRVSTMAYLDQAGQRYTRVLVMLWTRYLMSVLHQQLGTATADIPAFSQPRRGAVGPIDEKASPFTNLSTQLNPADPTVDPEGQLWTGPSLDALSSGEGVFIDAEGLEDYALFELLRCFLPFRAADAWAIVQPSQERTPSQGSTPNVRSTKREWWMLPAGLVVHGAKRVFVHWGNEQPRYSEDQLNNAAPKDNVDLLGLPPSRYNTLAAIEHLVQRHHCGAEARAAFDIAIWRLFGFKYSDSPVAKSNAPKAMASCFSTLECNLPRDYTAPAYLDAFRVPLSMPAEVASLLTATPAELAWGAFVLTIAGASALNWASFAFSLSGEVWSHWANRPSSPNQFVDIHSRAFLRTLLPDQTNPWGNSVANCLGLMYNFAPSHDVRLTSMRTVQDAWTRYSSPYFTVPYFEMWALSVIPSHQMFPIPQSVPLWEEGEPRPTAGLLDFEGRVRTARDLPRFSGRSWLQDGGCQYSAQHYISVGTGTSAVSGATAYRCTGHNVEASYQLGAWNSPFQYEWPASADVFSVDWVGAPGSTFADYSVPGSVRTFDLPANRLRAVGVKSNWKAGCSADVGSQMAMFNAARKQPLQGVAVTYIHPLPALREFEEVQDYSMLEVISKETGQFAGLVTVSKQTNPFDYAANSYVPQPAATWQPHEPAPLNVPAYLANHNDPGAPSSACPVNSIFPPGRTAPAESYSSRRSAAKKQHKAQRSALPAPQQSPDQYDPRPGGQLTAQYLAAPPPATAPVSAPQHPRVTASPSARFSLPADYQAPRSPKSPSQRRKSYTMVTAGVPGRVRPVPVAREPSATVPGFRASYETKNPNATEQLPPLRPVFVAPAAPSETGPAVVTSRSDPPHFRESADTQFMRGQSWSGAPAAEAYHAEAEPRYAEVPPAAGFGAGSQSLAMDTERGAGPVRVAQYMRVPANSVGPVSQAAPTDVAAATAQHEMLDLSQLPPEGARPRENDVKLVTSQLLRPQHVPEN